MNDCASWHRERVGAFETLACLVVKVLLELDRGTEVLDRRLNVDFDKWQGQLTLSFRVVEEAVHDDWRC